MKITITNVEVPLYFSTLQIVIAKNLNKALKKMKIKDHAEDYEAFVIVKRHKSIVFIKPSATIGTIAHETVHVVNNVFKNASVQLDIDNDEPQAYLTKWIVDKIYNALIKHNKNGN